MNLLTGFLLGFLGSIHCVGMCGPLVIALGSGRFTSRLIYNLGRIFTYFIFGLSFGLLGSRLELWGLQQLVSVTAGVLIVVFIFLPARYSLKVFEYTGLNKLIKTSGYLSGKSKGVFGKFLLGTINGFLPCPFVYLAVAGALSLGNVFEGGLFMLFFGIGTLPSLIGITTLYSFINLNLKRRFSRLYPVFAFAIGLLFILRGLNLGIPYISPLNQNNVQSNEIICQ